MQKLFCVIQGNHTQLKTKQSFDNNNTAMCIKCVKYLLCSWVVWCWFQLNSLIFLFWCLVFLWSPFIYCFCNIGLSLDSWPNGIYIQKAKLLTSPLNNLFSEKLKCPCHFFFFFFVISKGVGLSLEQILYNSQVENIYWMHSDDYLINGSQNHMLDCQLW